MVRILPAETGDDAPVPGDEADLPDTLVGHSFVPRIE